jgi:hypothetical protein
MKQRTLTLLGVALLLAAVAFAWTPVSDFLAVDSCLDAGGSFDYANGICDFERSHPYAPRADRSARAGAAVVLAIIGVALSIVGHSRRGQSPR